MGRVAIVTDSTADLPADLVASHGITVVPLSVSFGDTSFQDGVELSSGDFLIRLRSSFALPTTAQPPAGRFEEVYRALAAEHDAVVSVHISGKLSGTASSAQMAAEAVAGTIPVHVVDSFNASLALGFQALSAAELAATGLPAGEIAERLRANVGAYELAFFPETLEYLQRGGRVGKAQAVLGSVLSLKPILRVEEGAVVPHERTRTRSRAVSGLLEFARGIDQPIRIGILHTGDESEATSLAALVQPLTPEIPVTVALLGPVLLTHLGPGAMGIAIHAER